MHSPLLAHVWHCELTSTHATGMGAPVGGKKGAAVRGGAKMGVAVTVEHMDGRRGRHSRIARTRLRVSVGAAVGGLVGGIVGVPADTQQRAGV